MGPSVKLQLFKHIMNRDQKTTYVNDLKSVIAANEGILVYHYEGITVKDLESLRAKIEKKAELFFKNN